MSNLDALMPFDEALAVTLEVARSVRDRMKDPIVTRQLWECRGAMLAHDVLADRDQPPFPRAAMDGYAFHSADTSGDRTTLRVVGEVPAGAAWTGPAIERGECVAIMTGAAVPEPLDTVLQIERTTRVGDQMTIEEPVVVGRNVSPRGEDIREGAVAVPAGRVIGGLTIGALASVGAESVQVYRRPRVSVAGTGDELVELGDVPGPTQIRDSNRHTIMGLVQVVRARAVDLGRVADNVPSLRRAIRDGLDSDVLALSGGVSAGTYDLVAQTLAELGVEIVYHKVRMKPGKPVLLGRHAGGMVFGLPGNPVSTFVTGQLLMAPALRVLGRRTRVTAPTFEARLTTALRPAGGRTTFISGRVEHAEGGAFLVEVIPVNGSADQIAFAAGNCLIRREIGAPAASAGDMVTITLFAGAVPDG